MVLSALFATGSLALPFIVPAVRRINGDETYQMDCDNSHPVRFRVGDMPGGRRPRVMSWASLARRVLVAGVLCAVCLFVCL